MEKVKVTIEYPDRRMVMDLEYDIKDQFYAERLIQDKFFMAEPEENIFQGVAGLRGYDGRYIVHLISVTHSPKET